MLKTSVLFDVYKSRERWYLGSFGHDAPLHITLHQHPEARHTVLSSPLHSEGTHRAPPSGGGPPETYPVSKYAEAVIVVVINIDHILYG